MPVWCACAWGCERENAAAHVANCTHQRASCSVKEVQAHNTHAHNTQAMSSSSPSSSTTTAKAQAAAAAPAAAPTESKCPFTSLLGKFLPASLTSAITGTMPSTTTTATDSATGSNKSSSSGGGGCPLGYGRALASTQGAPATGGKGGTGGTCPLGFGSRSNTQTTTTTTGPPSASSLPEMNLATLQAHAHLNLVSIKGVIYDVTAQAQVRS